MATLRCVGCARSLESEALDASCKVCGSAVVLESERPHSVARGRIEGLPPGVWRYKDFLPDLSPEDIVTLGEGGTPLLRAERLGGELGLRNLLVKDESRNPTGSFMDRGSTVLLSLAKKRGVKECSCITTGNLGASLAAYCAKANVRARLMINPNTDQGKLYQMLAYGADIELSPRKSASPHHDRVSLAVTAANPYLLEGEKTTGFEIAQELGWEVPDVLLVPVGTGGHLLMIWRAILQLKDAGILREAGCRLLGVRVQGASPTPTGTGGRVAHRTREFLLAELEESEPFFLKEAFAAVAESGGSVVSTSSGDTIGAAGMLAKTEGIFAEPSSASVVAALSGAASSGLVDRSERVVCVITGAGLKDPKAVSRLAKEARRMPLRIPSALPSAQIGETKFALLQLLQRRPGYGYELRRKLGTSKMISTASVYQHLTELEGLAMVRRTGSVTSRGRERVFYELTRRGADYLKIAGKLQGARMLP